ncbi:unnamed protein product [Protopolystoma xenopodis]|uniref:Uncharacterized protein n=1 Tax=Protopolystoma xenopodis TaxID=117903 RepID=A0A448WH52_9PLAT|nr:unnamed protein product [Protopolystoma xenopodis]
MITFPAILPHQFILTHPFRKSAWRDHDALPNLFSSSFRNRCKVISADKMATRKQGTNSPSCSYAELATTPIDCAFIHSAAECGSEINTISGEVCREPLHPQPVILNSPSQRRSLMINSPCKPTHFDRFKMGLKRLLDHSTVHGLSHVSTAKSRLGRAAWFCLWLAGLTGFIFNMALIVERYISCPVLINNIEDYETFEWPDLTFCNPTTPYVLQNPEIKAKWLKLVEKARQTVDNLPRHEIFKELDQFEWSEIAVQTLVFSTISADEFRIGLVNEMLHFAAADVGRPGIALSMEENGKLIYLHSPLSDYAYTQFIQKRFNIPCITFQII